MNWTWGRSYKNFIIEPFIIIMASIISHRISMKYVRSKVHWCHFLLLYYRTFWSPAMSSRSSPRCVVRASECWRMVLWTVLERRGRPVSSPWSRQPNSEGGSAIKLRNVAQPHFYLGIVNGYFEGICKCTLQLYNVITLNFIMLPWLVNSLVPSHPPPLSCLRWKDQGAGGWVFLMK